VIALHEALEVDVAKNATLAAQGFAEWETWRAFDGQSGGVELHELQITKDSAGFARNRYAITGGDFRIGGIAVKLAESSSGEQNCASTELVAGAIVLVEKVKAYNVVFFDE
jgi:hypothetical protein